MGFEEIRGLNIKDKPGICYPNFSLTKESSTTITDKIIDTTFDNRGNLWAVSSAKLYKRTSAGTWSSVTLPGGGASGTLYGVAFWGAVTGLAGGQTEGWLFVFAGTTIDQLDLSDETTWSKGWQALGGSTAATVRPSFVASDNVLYIGLFEISYNRFSYFSNRLVAPAFR